MKRRRFKMQVKKRRILHCHTLRRVREAQKKPRVRQYELFPDSSYISKQERRLRIERAIQRSMQGVRFR